jgi:type VI secretion system protein ImpK
MTASADTTANKTHLAELKSHADTADAALAQKNTADSLTLPHQFIVHHPKAGLNPLVDAAAYLFSVIGKLKQLKSYRHLSKLQKELITAINQFQDLAKARGYSSEYILVSRFALCVTLDDVIGNTLWGGQGQWDTYNLLSVFNQDTMNNERFFVILERVIKDPVQYIDVMELMYLCLSLGFKGSYRATEFGNNQLELIINALYKRIRRHHGDFSKTLAPYPLKIHPQTKSVRQGISVWSVSIATAAIILMIFLGLGYMLDTISRQAYDELMHIGNSLLYETNHS